VKLWLKGNAGVYSDAGSTLATNGQTVQQWNDQSGNANNSSQATSGARPILRSTGINGLPAIEFDGVDDMLTVADTAALRLAPSLTLFVVFKRGETTRTSEGILDKLVNSGNFDGYGLYLSNHNPAIFINTNSTNNNFTSFGTADTTAHVLSASITYGGSCKAYLDGTNKVTATDGGSSVTETQPFRIGRHEWATNPHFQGLFGELLVYSGALVDADRQAVESYLKTQWGTP
jgi:hypothetical protein